MNKIKQLTHFGLSLLLVAGFIAVIFLIADGLGAWDLLKAQQQARAAEARSRELEAQAAALRERQAMLQTAVLAFASVKDSLLVTVTYLVGGLMLFLALSIIGVLLWERGQDHDRHLRA